MPPDSPAINTKSIAQNTYDAIVVGSGISGGWAAKELCEKGLKTLVLERGRNVEHIKDYPTANQAPWRAASKCCFLGSLVGLEPNGNRPWAGALLSEHETGWRSRDRDPPTVGESSQAGPAFPPRAPDVFRSGRGRSDLHFT